MLEHIWNPWHGCRKYSEGCLHCYMYFLDADRGKDGGEIYRVRTNFDLPLKKDRSGAYKLRSGETVHVCLTSDFFLEEADEWRRDAWDIIRARPDLHFWLQTKRADRVRQCLPDDWGTGWKHVSLCITAENQRCAEERLPILLSLPFHEKNVMCAPMLEEITLSQWLVSGQIGKVLVDGENYDGDRLLDFRWVEKLYRECLENDVTFDFCGTGNRFRKDNKIYHIPKAYQRVMAVNSGLQIPEKGKLPVDPKCRTCSARFRCGGLRCINKQ